MPRRTRQDVLADPFSAHEALDRAHLAAMFFDENVAEHAYVMASPQLRRVASDLAEQLASFYQLVGAAVFGEHSRETSGRSRDKPRRRDVRSSR